jgi:murein DD-endopeptidase MepM/ murein hydrolase activator NlpD
MSLKTIAVPLAAVGLMAVVGGQPVATAAPGGPGPGRLAWPLADWVETQAYGCTPFALEPVASWCPSGHFHGGVDMAAPAGTPVHAAATGVATVAWSPNGYGLYVVVRHGGGVSTLYGHLESTALVSGDPVGAGAEIGRVGSTGLSTGPHLHFEVRRDGRPVDPVPLLPARS